jgi:hypothetical protein
MKYMNLFDNFVMVPEFDECKGSPINLMNVGVCWSINVMLIIDVLWLTPRY